MLERERRRGCKSRDCAGEVPGEPSPTHQPRKPRVSARAAGVRASGVASNTKVTLTKDDTQKKKRKKNENHHKKKSVIASYEGDGGSSRCSDGGCGFADGRCGQPQGAPPPYATGGGQRGRQAEIDAWMAAQGIGESGGGGSSGDAVAGDGGAAAVCGRGSDDEDDVRLPDPWRDVPLDDQLRFLSEDVEGQTPASLCVGRHGGAGLRESAGSARG